jgi:hypothetical protein
MIPCPAALNLSDGETVCTSGNPPVTGIENDAEQKIGSCA